MKSVLVTAPGNASNLQWSETPLIQANSHEIIVKTKYFALNRMDLLQRDGKYNPPPGASNVLGVEFSGVIASLASDCNSGFKVGDAVFGLVPGGAYAEYVAIHESMLIHKPDHLEFVEAAALPEVFFTALQALVVICNIKKGDNLLLHAGASGVGTAAIQIAKNLGVNEIIVTAGSDEKIQFCKSLGATHGVNYKKEPLFSESILNFTNGKGADVVVDFIGANYWNENMKSIAKDGRMVMLGFMGGTIVDSVDLRPFLMKRIQVNGSTLRSRDLDYQIKLRNLFVETLLPLFEEKKLKPIIDRVFDWNQVSDAHTYLESNQSMGKILVKMP
ncbi:NAD(P)H quinone oxidoreductase, PIG3 family [Globomyces pollinis-pini]|nr:NAD(P)H quinone oxidoreductase, PIG3 family [Globomyces pollinis-pini]